MALILESLSYKYVIGQQLGAGTYGICYLSNIPGKYPVAVKVFKNHASSQ